MENLPYCIDFINGTCTKIPNCNFAHIEVEDKKAFIENYNRVEEYYKNILKYCKENDMTPSELKSDGYVLGVLIKCVNCDKGQRIMKDKIDINDDKFYLCSNCKNKSGEFLN